MSLYFNAIKDKVILNFESLYPFKQKALEFLLCSHIENLYAN